MNKTARLYELIDILNQASDYYYNKDTELMSNLEYDRLYDELVALEEKTGIIRADSPSRNVGYSVQEGLQKFSFDTAMLSLDKTKDVLKLKEFVGGNKAVLSYKLDGLTVVLTYEGGRLSNAVTRGNGRVGEVILENALHFKNLPIAIPYKDRLVLRGEAVISYKDFERINLELPADTDRYKNPRNLCSSTARALDSSVVAERGVHFFAFSVVEGLTELKKVSEQLEMLKALGFAVVDYRITDSDSIVDTEVELSRGALDYPYPVDGLVLILDDIEYGLSLGSTSKFPRNAIAFKWQDEEVETALTEVFWSASRTGRVNPIAIFEPVEIEGTVVSRASLHNLSQVKALKLGIGDRITVYKANMIIPQIARNITESDSIEPPKNCPVCGSELKIEDNDGVQVLYCRSADCPAKKIKGFELFVSRDAFNIEGLSAGRLELLISHGFLHSYADIFRLELHRQELTRIDGFGERSVDKLLAAIQKSRNVGLAELIYSLGIPNVGKTTANILARHYGSIEALSAADRDSLKSIYDIGDIVAGSIVDYLAMPENIYFLDELVAIIEIKPVSDTSSGALSGRTFVITGSLHTFDSRRTLQARIESLGGKVASAVSKNTDYLINNDISSNSSKNKKARELGIDIISEEDFLKMLED